MSEEIGNNQSLLIALTADIVSAYVGNNAVPVRLCPS